MWCAVYSSDGSVAYCAVSMLEHTLYLDVKAGSVVDPAFIQFGSEDFGCKFLAYEARDAGLLRGADWLEIECVRLYWYDVRSDTLVSDTVIRGLPYDDDSATDDDIATVVSSFTGSAVQSGVHRIVIN